MKSTIGTVTDIERYQYGYNLASLKQWRRNVVAASQNAGQDEYYRYDGLKQVEDRQLGTLNLNRTAISGVPGKEEQWGYDPAGNWDQYRALANGQVSEEIESSFNKVNEYRTYRGNGGSSAPVAYDANGNMTTVPADVELTPDTRLVWDAWNRLVRVQRAGSSSSSSPSSSSSSSSSIPSSSQPSSSLSSIPSLSSNSLHLRAGNVSSSATPALDIRYAYDGLSRCTKRTVVSGSQPSLDYYWNQQWKCVYAQDSANSNHYFRYAYGVRRRNELLMREEWNPSLTTIFPLCDAMSSRTTLIDSNATVLERYRYSAFGMATVLNPDYTVRGSSYYGWDVLFHGEMIDLTINWYNYGYRWYIPNLGRWPSRDPLPNAEKSQGPNLYWFVKNDAVNGSDLWGLYSSAASFREKCGAVCCAGIHGARKAQELAHQAFKEAQQSGLSGAHNGAQDAYRHCLWSCLMAKALGKKVAKCITDNHEDANDRDSNQPKGERQMDEANNKVGRDTARNSGDCKSGCMNQLHNGNLSGSDGKPMPSPPTPTP